ncbi:MAG TPA: hypothetical protein VGM26_07060 [Rhizomicrobium sp.]
MNVLSHGASVYRRAFSSQIKTNRLLAMSVLLLCICLGFPSPLQAAEAIADFTIVNDEGAMPPGRIVSFGQMFRKGSIRPGAPVSVMLNGAKMPCQMNAKALYPDGSVRHGVLTLQLPVLRGNLNGTIFATGGDAGTAAPTRPPPDLDVIVTLNPGTDHAKTVHARLPEIVKAAGARRDAPWLTGSLVQEQRYYGPSIDGIQLVFDLWSPAAGPSRVDVIFHNDSADNPDIDTRAYAVIITIAGQTVYSTGTIWHYAHSDWHKLVYADGIQPPKIVPDIALLKETGAIPNYAAVTPDRNEMAKFHPKTLDDGAPPLDPAGLTMYMPTTGGRSDIGPLPSWAVFYLLAPSRENLNTLIATADAAGSVPWHVRDLATNGPIDIDLHPDVWLDGRGQAVPGILARKYYVSDTKWTPDDAHQPSLAYLPYLLTGSQYYRDELTMQAGYVLLAVDPRYRAGSAGLLLGSQVRAVAWGLRTLANAAFILPADDPHSRYFKSKLEGNLQEIARRYISGHELDGAGELKGYLPGPYAVEGTTPPWQSNYLVIVLGWIDRMGFAQARPVLDWMGNFAAGLFTNGDRGYDPIYGTPYFLYVQEPATGQFINTWAGAFRRTFDPATKPVRALDYPDWGGGYAAVARAALASLITSTGSPRTRQAYQFVIDNTPGMTANYAKDPVFAIVPVPERQANIALRDKDAP